MRVTTTITMTSACRQPMARAAVSRNRVGALFKDMTNTVNIPRRFRGPPDSGNGGYPCQYGVGGGGGGVGDGGGAVVAARTSWNTCTCDSATELVMVMVSPSVRRASSI